MIGGLDRVTAQAVLNNMKRTSNLGYPGGQGMDTSFIDEFLKGMGSLPPINWAGTGSVGGSLPGTIIKK
jgi:hypothetical protein